VPGFLNKLDLPPAGCFTRSPTASQDVMDSSPSVLAEAAAIPALSQERTRLREHYNLVHRNFFSAMDKIGELLVLGRFADITAGILSLLGDLARSPAGLTLLLALSGFASPGRYPVRPGHCSS
jgi:hypothetical protein